MKSYRCNSRRRLLLFLLAAILAPASLLAEVQIRLSIKVILDSNGDYPTNSANFGGAVNVTFDTEQKIRDNVTFMNDLARQMGYCFRFFLRSNTVCTVSGQSDPWFEDKEARNNTNKDDLAVASPTTWNWHSDSINIYINNTSSGWCSFPSQNESLIFIGSGSYQTLIIHEIGHFFSLPHTHGADGVIE